MGLSVVKGIIEKHRGDIKIENEACGGTRVIIELPCNPDETPREVAE